MRINRLLVATMLVMFVFSIHIAEPVAAAKMKIVDKGSHVYYISDLGSNAKDSWKTYQKGVNYVKVNGYTYVYDYNDGFSVNFILQKVSKKKLKVTVYLDGKRINTHYKTTKLTAAQYYWRIFRPAMISPKPVPITSI